MNNSTNIMYVSTEEYNELIRNKMVKLESNDIDRTVPINSKKISTKFQNNEIILFIK